MTRLFAVTAMLAVVLGLRLPAQVRPVDGLSLQTWKVGDVERTALVATPRSNASSAGAPLVLVFHGHGGTSAQAVRSFGIHTAWPEALVMYPQGLPTAGQITDPEGRLPGWQHFPTGEGDRDLKFVDAMLAWARKERRVDAARVFAAGHSNGGSMVYVLWAARAHDFAAFAPSSSVFRPDAIVNATPKPAFIIAGEQDLLVPFRTQQLSLSRVLKLNQAATAGQAWEGAARLHPSKAGADVVTYIHSGGHQLPAAAGTLMVKFFKQR
jgi:polyhydroxybutyrate depolymerase